MCKQQMCTSHGGASSATPCHSKARRQILFVIPAAVTHPAINLLEHPQQHKPYLHLATASFAVAATALQPHFSGVSCSVLGITHSAEHESPDLACKMLPSRHTVCTRPYTFPALCLSPLWCAQQAHVAVQVVQQLPRGLVQ